MNFRRTALRGVGWSALQTWGGQVVSLVILALLARMLGPEEFGLVALATLFVSFIQIFIDQGFSSAIVQLQILDNAHLNTAFWTNVAISVILTGVCIVSSPLIAGVFNEPDLVPIMRWVSLSLIMSGLSSTQRAILSRNMEFRNLSTRSLGASVAGGVAGVTAALIGLGVWSLVVQNLTKSVIGTILLWDVSVWRPHLQFSKDHFTEMFSFGVNIVGINLLNFMNRHVDDLLIGFFLGSVALGYYSIAYRLLLTLTNMMLRIISTVAFPLFSRLQTQKDRLRDTYLEAVRYSCRIAFPVFIGVALLAPEIINIMYGSGWEVSIPILRLLALAGVIQSIGFFDSPMLHAVGKPHWDLRLTALSATMNVIGFLIAVQFGVIAVALAFLIKNYLFYPIQFSVLKKLIEIKWSDVLRQVAAPAVGSLTIVLGVALSTRLLPDIPVLLETFVMTIIGAGTYSLTMWLIEPNLASEIKIAINQIAFSGRRSSES